MSGPDGPATDRLATFAAPPFDASDDLCGDPIGARIRALFAGNQFMVLPELVTGFLAANPRDGPVFYETLPPGVLIAQLRAGGLRLGCLELRFTPDLIAASPGALGELYASGHAGAPQSYASNRLATLVRAGNPARRSTSEGSMRSRSCRARPTAPQRSASSGTSSAKRVGARTGATASRNPRAAERCWVIGASPGGEGMRGTCNLGPVPVGTGLPVPARGWPNQAVETDPVAHQEALGMCMNCGCMEPNDKHGNDANITLDQMRSAAQANGQDLDQAMDNMEKTYHQAVEGGEKQATQHQHAF